MVNYQPIAALVTQISVDTWDVLRQIKERRPAMMLSELIDCRTRASQRDTGTTHREAVQPRHKKRALDSNICSIDSPCH
jgi:hypothetical protein